MSKSTLAEKIQKEFIKKDILTLNEIYITLSQDMELKVLTPIIKHSVRSSIYSMKKSGKIELIDKATYKIIKQMNYSQSSEYLNN